MMLLRVALQKALKIPAHSDRCYICGKKLHPIMIYFKCHICGMPYCTDHYEKLKSLPECPYCGSENWNE